jgi:ribosomal protein L29
MTTKLKINDLRELKKAGLKALEDKIQALQIELGRFDLDRVRGQSKNLKAGKTLRRGLAQLKTIKSELEAKKKI